MPFVVVACGELVATCRVVTALSGKLAITRVRPVVKRKSKMPRYRATKIERTATSTVYTTVCVRVGHATCRSSICVSLRYCPIDDIRIRALWSLGYRMHQNLQPDTPSTAFKKPLAGLITIIRHPDKKSMCAHDYTARTSLTILRACTDEASE